MIRGSAALVTAVLAALVVSVPAAGATPRHASAGHHTAAGTALARATLLRRRDLGWGWREQASPPTKVPSLTCPRFAPSVRGAVETGAAASPTFEAGRYGPFVSEISHTYATSSQRAAVWRAIARPGLRRCGADSLRRNGGHGVHFAVTGAHLLRLPSPLAPAAGYRISGTASLTYQTVNVYLDMLVLGRGQTIAAILVSSFEQPPSRRLELRLAGAVARRMSGSGNAS